MTVAVRNPLKDRAMIMMSLEGVPRDYFVYFPHRWLYLEPLGERKLDLIIAAMIDIQEMRQKLAQIKLYGQVARVYTKPIDMTGVPASWNCKPEVMSRRALEASGTRAKKPFSCWISRQIHRGQQQSANSPWLPREKAQIPPE